MESATIDKVYDVLLKLRKDVDKIKFIVEEDFELSDDVIEEIKDSRKRSKKEFISQEEMRLFVD